jgi:iron-sulfur cluster repair protein YtfE (RIC family)
MQEHDEALVQLKLLNRAVRSLTVEGYTNSIHRRVLAALRFIEEEVRIHNAKEEEALFPVLERYVEGPTKIMRSDHRKLHRGFLQLSRAVDGVNANRDSFKAIRRLDTIARDVIQQFVNHIHKENHILFPMVQQFLTKDELREIARKLV